MLVALARQRGCNDSRPAGAMVASDRREEGQVISLKLMQAATSLPLPSSSREMQENQADSIVASNCSVAKSQS